MLPFHKANLGNWLPKRLVSGFALGRHFKIESILTCVGQLTLKVHESGEKGENCR